MRGRTRSAPVCLSRSCSKEPYLSSGTRGKRPAFSGGTAEGGKPADNVSDGSSQRNHWATPATHADEWGQQSPAKEPA